MHNLRSGLGPAFCLWFENLNFLLGDLKLLGSRAESLLSELGVVLTLLERLKGIKLHNCLLLSKFFSYPEQDPLVTYFQTPPIGKLTRYVLLCFFSEILAKTFSFPCSSIISTKTN